MQQQVIKQSSANILIYLALLTTFFLLLEISFFIQCNKAYLGDFTYVTDHLHIPASILPGIFYFIAAQLSVHVAYTLLVWLVTCCIANAYVCANKRVFTLSIGVWLIGIVTALTANQYYFPNSKFSELTALIFFNQTIAEVMFIICVVTCSLLLLSALLGFCKMMLRLSLYQRAWVLSSTALLSMVISLSVKPDTALPVDAATAEQPNIILIGVDSLRPDFLSYFGGDTATPAMDTFLTQAIVFNDAVTPLARTFPSWAGILSGQYPRKIGIRFDLANQESLNLSQLLPVILQHHGYNTMFATDETRFSNIDKNFGFAQIVSPPMGLNDFLLGTFNDFPLSNLLVNTGVGKWLFPYSYANRPVYFTYNPNTFLTMLYHALPTRRVQPLFLAVHFCLPHTPYLWAEMPENDSSYLQRYAASVRRVDQQINDFFSILKQKQLLNHAIVVLLSDHGEALELSGDRITEKELFTPTQRTIPTFYPPSLDHEAVNQSAGHGTDVLGLSQYHSLLAFKIYGSRMAKPNNIPGTVTLLSIQPTILDLVNLSSQRAEVSAVSAVPSLAAIVKGKHEAHVAIQHIFLESDFSPMAIRTVYPQIHEVMLEGIQLFSIDPLTTRLTFKKSMGIKIIRSKQYADIYGEWILALYPQSHNKYIPILVNLITGEWTNDMHSALAQHAPVLQMYEKLKQFNNSELNPLTL